MHIYATLYTILIHTFYKLHHSTIYKVQWVLNWNCVRNTLKAQISGGNVIRYSYTASRKPGLRKAYIRGFHGFDGIKFLNN